MTPPENRRVIRIARLTATSLALHADRIKTRGFKSNHVAMRTPRAPKTHRNLVAPHPHLENVRMCTVKTFFPM
jgi:hypothetical protein